MNRDYDSGENSQAIFFVGEEVEHTPAFGKVTMFIVGVHSIAEIDFFLENNPYGIEHLYFGANQSFPDLDIHDSAEWKEWETMIAHYLEQGWLCTLDLDVNCVEGLLEGGLVEHHNFIPMISVKLPYIQQLGYNATIKLDDIDFKATNPGVWCHSLHDLKDRSKFTDWSQYTQDQILKC